MSVARRSNTDDTTDDDVFLSPAVDGPPEGNMSGPAASSPHNVVVHSSRASSGYHSRPGSSQNNSMSQKGLHVNEKENLERRTPSPTGYRGVIPPGVEIPTPEEDDVIHKTILLGDSGVGKTSLLVQFDTGKFQPGTFSATVGIGFTNKIVPVDSSKVKLQIWDTAGQERFRSVTHAYYRDAHALLLLYDVTSRVSYDNTRAWLAEVHEYAQDDVVIMLIGNKCDVPLTSREIRKEDGESLAREYNVIFMETSAKTGLNVDLAFTAIARKLKNRKVEQQQFLEKKFNVVECSRTQKADPCGCVY